MITTSSTERKVKSSQQINWSHTNQSQGNWLSNQDSDRKRVFSNPAPPSQHFSSILSDPHSTDTMTGDNDCNTPSSSFLTLQDPPRAYFDEEHWNFDTLLALEDVSLPSTPPPQPPRSLSWPELFEQEMFDRVPTPETPVPPEAIMPPSPSRVSAFATSDEPIIRTISASVRAFLEVTTFNEATEPETYRLEFHQAIDFFGEDVFTHEPGRRRLVLANRARKDLNTPFFKYAMEAGLPTIIFRWFQGELDTDDLDFSASHIDQIIEELTEKGISSAEGWQG